MTPNIENYSRYALEIQSKIATEKKFHEKEKKLKAHREATQDNNDLPIKLFPGEYQEGRAALRYASVDREQSESHISLSSCKSDSRQTSNKKQFVQ